MNDTDLILRELRELRNEIKDIKNELKVIKKGTDRMETHISFVDSVYDSIKHPFHFLMDTVRKVNNTPIIKDEQLKAIN